MKFHPEELDDEIFMGNEYPQNAELPTPHRRHIGPSIKDEFPYSRWQTRRHGKIAYYRDSDKPVPFAVPVFIKKAEVADAIKLQKDAYVRQVWQTMVDTGASTTINLSKFL